MARGATVTMGMGLRYLFCAIGDGGDVGWDLAESGALLAQSLLHFPDVLLHPALDLLGGVIEFAGNARGLVQHRGRHGEREIGTED